MASPSPFKGIRSDKLCECGCGGVTFLIEYTNARQGRRAGEPNRFLPNHSPRRRQRFEVDEHGCFVADWLNANGYGCDARFRAWHRRVYIECFGPIPSDWHVHHRCENKACVNPEHLEALSPADHQLAHHETKRRFWPEDYRRVAELSAAGTPLARLAEEYGTSGGHAHWMRERGREMAHADR